MHGHPRRVRHLATRRAALPKATATLLVLAAALAARATPAMAEGSAYSTLGAAGLRTGVIVDRAQCPDAEGHAWVTAPHADGTDEGAYIRYYAAGLGATNPTAVVFIHGNRLTRVYDDEGRLIRIGANPGYGRATEDSLRRAAAQQAAALRLPFVMLARPGYYGSSGIAAEQYRRREVLLLNAALDAIRQRHAIGRLAVSAQSGGGPSLDGMLALRDDLACAVFSSALTAFDEQARALGPARRGPPLRQATPDAYDPIREVASIRPGRDRRVFVIGDPGDRQIPIAAQQAYADALQRYGIRVTAMTGTAVGATHHSLDGTGIRAAGWCLDGLPDEEIRSLVGRGEAEYRVEGVFN